MKKNVEEKKVESIHQKLDIVKHIIRTIFPILILRFKKFKKLHLTSLIFFKFMMFRHPSFLHFVLSIQSGNWGLWKITNSSENVKY